MQAAGKQEKDGALIEKLRKEIGERRLSLDAVSYTHLTLPTTPYV